MEANRRGKKVFFILVDHKSWEWKITISYWNESYFETKLVFWDPFFSVGSGHILRMYYLHWEQMNKNDSSSINLEVWMY